MENYTDLISSIEEIKLLTEQYRTKITECEISINQSYTDLYKQIEWKLEYLDCDGSMINFNIRSLLPAPNVLADYCKTTSYYKGINVSIMPGNYLILRGRLSARQIMRVLKDAKIKISESDTSIIEELVSTAEQLDARYVALKSFKYDIV